MDRKIFQQIRVKIPRKRILARLGYANGKTKFSQDSFLRFESYLDSALNKINLRGVAVCLEINEIKKGEINLEGGLEIKSNSLEEFLKNCQEVFFIGATAGRDIIKLISGTKNSPGLEGPVVADAVASEMADAALGWIVDYQARHLRRQNKILTQQRFSAGYRDFKLQYQKLIYDILKLDEIGVKLKAGYVLEPEKTVTAVCGIKQLS